MKSPFRPVLPVLALGFGLGLIAACNSLIGAGAPNLIPSGGAGGTAGADSGPQCLHASECPNSEVCLFRVCSAACVADKDCELGRCLQTADGTACVVAASATCSSAKDCPEGSLCKVGTCRTSCTDDSKCLADQTCIAGACVGSDPIHDPGAGGSAGDGNGDSGAGGNSGGSAGGSAGGSTGGAAGSGGAVQVGPDTGLAKAGDPCATQGDLACAEHASPLRLVCQGGAWTQNPPCDTGELCDSASKPFGQCQKLAPDCAGHNAGDSFCNSQTRIKCGADLITEDQTKCDSAALCLVGSGAACGACTSDQHQCVGNELQRCKDDGTGFEDQTPCSDAMPCNAVAGACTAFACLKAGALSCIGDNLEACNAARTGFTLSQACGPGLCNPTLLKCDVCSPSSSSCAADLATVSSCSADGQTLSMNKCMASTPHCVGNGQCIQCLATTDCPVPPDCYARSCSGAGSCMAPGLGLGASCAGGTKVCTAANACVQCNTTAQCPTPPMCYAATCNNNTCGTMPLPSGTCPAGFCNGLGSCVQCVNNSNCNGVTSLCRGGNCLNPAEQLGPATGATTANLVTGNLYLIKLPPITHNCTLTDFGIVTSAGAASTGVKLGLYASDANGLPTGPYVDYGAAVIPVNSGKLVDTPAFPTSLTPGLYYIAISTNTASAISIVSTTSTGAGYKVADTYNSSPSVWTNLTGVVGLAAYSNQLAAFIDVVDSN